MQTIPACTICGAPELDRWCAVCHDRTEAHSQASEAERIAEEGATLTAEATGHDVF
jgi:hypothetical protein